jgi:zinc/manganese transport system substrate-binding protein
MRLFAAVFVVCAAWAVAAQATAPGKIAIVAAENFYGNIAAQIGGDRVTVVSILNNPDQDPHLFETAPSVVRQIADARIIIVNGANYDSWMDKLMAAAPRPDRTVISAAQLVNAKAGDNPHLWYAPATMPAVAKAIAATLTQADGAHAAQYGSRLQTVLTQLDRIAQRVAQLRARHDGKPITATEPVFGLMAGALGLTVRNERFQLAMMNDTEPSTKEVATFEDDLKNHKVKALIYNRQVSEKLTERLLAIAKKAKVPVVGVTETQPASTSFTDWMLGEMDALDKALTGPNS